MFVFSILFNFRNYVPKPKMIPDYSKKEINFEDFEEEKEKDYNKNLNLDPELESIRLEIKNLIDDLKGIFFKNYYYFYYD